MPPSSTSYLSKERSLPSFWALRSGGLAISGTGKGEARQRTSGKTTLGKQLRPYLLPGLLVLGLHLALLSYSSPKQEEPKARSDDARTQLSLVSPGEGSATGSGKATAPGEAKEDGDSLSTLAAKLRLAEFQPAPGTALSSLPVLTDAPGGFADTAEGASETVQALKGSAGLGSAGFGIGSQLGVAGGTPGTQALVAPLPFYPEKARLEGRKGVVELQIRLDAEGRPLSVQVALSSGHGDLDETARQAVFKSWRFPKPSGAGNSLRVSVRFDLSQSEEIRLSRR